MAQDSPHRSIGQVTAGALAGEVLGTFMFTFSGTATVLAVHRLSPHAGFTAMDDIAISLAFAFGVLAAVYTVAQISGAHINPAVTIALAVIGRFPWRQVPGYLVAQFVGGIAAGYLNWFLFGDDLRSSLLLGSTRPGAHVPVSTALVAEIVITMVLMIVVMATAVFERAPAGGAAAGVAIGLWVGAAVFLALPLSGASLNPARTIGPDIAAGAFPSWWIYVVGPVVGAVIGAVLWKFLLSAGRKEVIEGDDEGPP